jgi:peptidoglycan/LPS O-acetylase OafA/YrhL
MKYRREIDGLRAIAVIPVILYHAGFAAFSGGFVGVDVFFVISGYLITSIIIEEREQESFSILHFYERRARRILPALFIVMLTCIPLAWFILTPSELKDLSKSLIAVPLFVSNILFWQDSGYFELTNELKPLIHTWSLAVEEQFYLFYPLFLLLLWRIGKNWLIGVSLLIALSSFFIAQWGVIYNPEAAFYLLPTRGWELLVGSLTSIYFLYWKNKSIVRNFEKIRNECLGIIGICLIGYAVFTFDKSTPFPGIRAAIPVIGAALIILFSSPQTLLGNVLGNKLLVGCGLISYSAYLWHQPLFAFARYHFSSQPSDNLYFALIIIVFALAYLGWRFVEMPFRKKNNIARKTVIKFSLLGSVFFIIIGLLGIVSNGFDYRNPPNIIYDKSGEKNAKKSIQCQPLELKNYEEINACSFGDSSNSEKTVALYGDSHAQMLLDTLDQELKEQHIKGIHLKTLSDRCFVDPKVRVKGRETIPSSCDQAHSSLLEFIKAEVDYVIISSRWTYRLYPVSGAIDNLSFNNEEGGLEFENYREYGVLRDDGKFFMDGLHKKKSLTRLINSFLSTGVGVILIYPVPELGWNIYLENYHYYSSNNAILPNLSTSYSLYKQRNKFVIDVFDDIPDRENFIRIRPEEVFCNTFLNERCVGQINGIPLYFDDDHLSNEGAQMLIDTLSLKS